MSLPNALWRRRRPLDLRGFNPAPIATNGRLWAITRLKTGSLVTELDPEHLTPIGPARHLHPAAEDFRTVPHTTPTIAHGTQYGPPPRQIAINFYPDAPDPRPITTPALLHIPTARNPDRPKPQKNWLIWKPTADNLQLWYHANPLTIAEPISYPHPWAIVHRHPWTPPAWAADLHAEIRLSAAPISIPAIGLLWLWHLKDRSSQYWTGAAISEPQPPYTPTHASACPLLTPDDATGLSPHWPPNRCIFAMQLELIHPDTLRLWAGDSDRFPIALETPLTNILTTLRPLRP